MKLVLIPPTLLMSILCLTAVLTPQSLMAAPTTEIGNLKSLALNDKGIKAMSENNLKLAEEFFRNAIEVDAGNLTAAFNLAGVLVVNKKKDEALSLLSKYTQKYPVDAGLFSRYGDLLFSTGKIKEAVVSYEKAFSLDKNYQRLTARLGLGYALLNRLDESEQMYLAAVTQAPQDAELLGNLSSTLLANGKPDKAIPIAKESLRLAPNKEVYVTLGSAYEAKKDFKAALASLRRAKELGADSEELKKTIGELEKLVPAE